MSAATLTLRPFAAADDLALLGWFQTPEELRRFAGTSLRWPLDRGQLSAIRSTSTLVAWTGVVPDAPDVPIGHIELDLALHRRGRIARVALAPSHRGRGLGRALVGAAVADAAMRDLVELDLRVLADNTPARRLYASLGFVLDGTDDLDRTLLRMVYAG